MYSMKFSFKYDILQKILKKFLNKYSIILTYSKNMFKIHQIINEECLISLTIQKSFVKLPKKRNSFSIVIPLYPFKNILDNTNNTSDIIFIIKDDVTVKIGKKIEFSFPNEKYILPLPDFPTDITYEVDQEFINIIKYAPPDSVVKFSIDGILQIMIQDQDFSCTYEIDTDILDTSSSSFLQKHLYDVLKNIDENYPLRMSILDKKPLYITQEDDIGFLELFVAPFFQ